MATESDYNIKPVTARHQTVAIVGKPNVGKSALFNRIVGRKMAIVHHQSGVTRDRVAALADYGDCRFTLVDTGGLGLFNDQKKGESAWDTLIREQLHVAVESADKVIFVVDVTEDLHALDEEVARLLHESGKQVFLAGNKADNGILADGIDTFKGLGFDNTQAISCVQNSGISALLDRVCRDMPPVSDVDEGKQLKIAVVGRPNVGKSSIINRLIGEERVIVSDVAGTTRDAIDIPLNISYNDRETPAVIIDTAGIKRKNKVDTAVDFFSMARTNHAINQADVIIFVMDSQQPATAMDRRIARSVSDAGKPCLILMNKWDLAGVKQAELYGELEYYMPFMSYAERVAVCAVSGYNFKEVIPRIIDLAEQVEVEYPTSLINRVVQDCLLRQPPPRAKGKLLKVYYATCVSRRPPTFVLFVNDKTICQGNYLAFLKNQFVQAFGIYGMPVVIELRNRSRDDSRKALFEDKKPGRPKKGKGSKPSAKSGKTKSGKGKKNDSRPAKGKPGGKTDRKPGRKRR